MQTSISRLMGWFSKRKVSDNASSSSSRSQEPSSEDSSTAYSLPASNPLFAPSERLEILSQTDSPNKVPSIVRMDEGSSIEIVCGPQEEEEEISTNPPLAFERETNSSNLQANATNSVPSVALAQDEGNSVSEATPTTVPQVPRQENVPSIALAQNDGNSTVAHTRNTDGTTTTRPEVPKPGNNLNNPRDQANVPVTSKNDVPSVGLPQNEGNSVATVRRAENEGTSTSRMKVPGQQNISQDTRTNAPNVPSVVRPNDGKSVTNTSGAEEQKSSTTRPVVPVPGNRANNSRVETIDGNNVPSVVRKEGKSVQRVRWADEKGASTTRPLVSTFEYNSNNPSVAPANVRTNIPSILRKREGNAATTVRRAEEEGTPTTRPEIIIPKVLPRPEKIPTQVLPVPKNNSSHPSVDKKARTTNSRNNVQSNARANEENFEALVRRVQNRTRVGGTSTSQLEVSRPRNKSNVRRNSLPRRRGRGVPTRRNPPKCTCASTIARYINRLRNSNRFRNNPEMTLLIGFGRFWAETGRPQRFRVTDENLEGKISINPFFNFLRAMRTIRKFQRVRQARLARFASILWRSLSDDEKMPFRKSALEVSRKRMAAKLRRTKAENARLNEDAEHMRKKCEKLAREKKRAIDRARKKAFVERSRKKALEGRSR